MVDRALERKKKSLNGQMDLFGDIIEDTNLIEDNEYPNINEYVNQIKLQYEKEIAGTYLSGHPLEEYMNVIKDFNFNSSMIPSENIEDEDLDNEMINDYPEDEELYNGLKNGDPVTCGGVITELKIIATKSGSRMAFATIEDLTGNFEAVVFNKAYEKFKDILANDVLVAIKGKFSLRDGKRPSIVVDNIEVLTHQNENTENKNSNNEKEVEVVKPKKLWLKYNINDGILHDAVKKILSGYNGIDEVYIIDKASRKAFKTNTLVTIRESLIFELETIIDKSDILIQD